MKYGNIKGEIMKKGQVGEGIVQRVEFPNKGIVVTEDGEKIIVKNTIPGQKVSFGVNKVRKGKAEGRLLEILKRSEDERKEYCPHFESCGGCTYQSLPYEKQLEIKKNQVLALLDPVITTPYEFQGIKASPSQKAYRNKMEFTFGDEYKDGPLALGMHKRGSFYDLVTVENCEIVDEDCRKILMATLNFFADRNIPYYHRMRHDGYLRHLLVRKATKTGEILIDLITSTQIAQDEDLLNQWKDCILALSFNGTMKGILHTKNDSVADVIKNEGTDILYGQDFFYEELLGLRFKISPFSFFQTNSLGAEVLYETAREFILSEDSSMLKDKIVYDLYSGTGTIAQMLAPVAKEVVGVEIVEEAVEAAKENAALNGLTNCKFLAGDVLKVLDTIEEKPDYIVLDPPRDGIHPKAIEKIINYGVENMIYISCKPTSLARDLEIFQARGYEVKKVCCVDMFPGTVHVETVAKLSLKTNQPKFKVAMEVEPDSNYVPEERVTYGKIQEYVKNKYGVNVHTSYIAQVKRMCGLDMEECYNKSKKENPEVKQCPQEKVEYVKDALKHFNLI